MARRRDVLRAGSTIFARDLMPEAWQDMELLEGWSTRAGYPVPSFRRLPGGRVEIVGGLIDGNTDNGARIALVPEEYAPANHMGLPLLTNAGETLGMFVRINGDIEIFRKADAKEFSAIYFSATYPLGR